LSTNITLKSPINSTNGNTFCIQKKIEKISDGQNIHHILIVASGINFIDLSGMETLASEHNRCGFLAIFTKFLEPSLFMLSIDKVGILGVEVFAKNNTKDNNTPK
jgi:SulP family sulfate permease